MTGHAISSHGKVSNNNEWKMPAWPKRDEKQCNGRIYRAEKLMEEVEQWFNEKQELYSKMEKSTLGFISVTFDKISSNYEGRIRYKEALFQLIEAHRLTADKAAGKSIEEKHYEKEGNLPEKLANCKKIELLEPSEQLRINKNNLLKKLEEGVRNFGTGKFGNVLIYYYHCLKVEKLEPKQDLSAVSNTPANKLALE